MSSIMANYKRDPHGYSTIDKGAELTTDEVEFGKACEEFRRSHNIKFLSCSQLLKIAKNLGYSKYKPT